MSNLRSRVIKLATENPEGIREHLVPLLKSASSIKITPHSDLPEFLREFGETVLDILLSFAGKLASSKKLYNFHIKTERSRGGFYISDSKHGFAMGTAFIIPDRLSFNSYVAMNENSPLEKLLTHESNLTLKTMMLNRTSPTDMANFIKKGWIYNFNKVL